MSFFNVSIIRNSQGLDWLTILNDHFVVWKIEFSLIDYFLAAIQLYELIGDECVNLHLLWHRSIILSNNRFDIIFKEVVSLYQFKPLRLIDFNFNIKVRIDLIGLGYFRIDIQFDVQIVIHFIWINDYMRGSNDFESSFELVALIINLNVAFIQLLFNCQLTSLEVTTIGIPYWFLGIIHLICDCGSKISLHLQ